MFINNNIWFHTLSRYKNGRLLKATQMSSQIVMAMSNGTFAKLSFSKYGHPIDVIEYKQEEIRPPNTTEVLLKMQLAPVHEGDMSIIQNRFPFKVKLPSAPGMEGIGIIEQVGSSVQHLQPGDRVVFTLGVIGSWSNYCTIPADNVIKVRNDVDMKKQSVLSIAATAYRVLKDFVALKPGDTIIQNGANGCVGRFIIQLCKMWGINSINVVRDRPTVDALKADLFTLGATYVITEQETRGCKGEDLLGNAQVAFNCVGGAMAKALFNLLPPRTLYVTYGSVTEQPVPANMATLVFKDITFKGFWLNHWYNHHTNSEVANMLDEIAGYLDQNKLVSAPIYHCIPLSDYTIAFNHILYNKGFLEKKFIFDMTQ